MNDDWAPRGAKVIMRLAAPSRCVRLTANIRRRWDGCRQMNRSSSGTEVLAVKDESARRPIPTAWRPVFCDIVSAFVENDYRLERGVFGVESVSADLAAHIREYIHAYGATLAKLPEETWDSSVCIWYGTHWDALVDMWTQEEGRSDLVLHVHVRDLNPGFELKIHLVYVP